MGALRYSDRKRWVEFVKKGNSESFKKVLKLFYEEMISEWLEAGNQREDFAEHRPKLVIVLDNASFHKKAEMLKEIATEMPNIHLEYLPEHSPDYNLIE